MSYLADIDELPQRPRKRRSPARAITSFLVVALLAAGSVWALTNRQYIDDQFTVWDFESTTVLEGYIVRTTMTEHGAFLFRASTPHVAEADKFNTVCASLEEGSGVLGCYLPGVKTITLYDVTDDRLDGIEDVVASHEMLHAAWDRMSDDERNAVAPLLETEATRLSGNKDFAARMELYARTEPKERLNELNSIIGTEIADISPELETYYARFFSDRQAVVALHVSSNAVFLQIEEQSTALLAEMDALRTGVDADYATYNAGYDDLSNDIDAFNVRADNGSFTSTTQFNRERKALMDRQAALDALYASIQARADSYDAKYKQLQELNSQAADLNTKLNIIPRSDSDIQP